MKESIEIIVTREDIEKGVREDESLCPIAVAVKRETPENAYISVGSKLISVGPRCIPLKHYHLPSEAIHFIKAFDNGIEVKPFVFTALLFRF